jgi:hypothetical protein
VFLVDDADGPLVDDDDPDADGPIVDEEEEDEPLLAPPIN